MYNNGFNRLVVIAERTERRTKDVNLSSTDLEKIDQKYIDRLLERLYELFPNLIHYLDLESFIENIKHHKEDLILSSWHGENSRNRLSLVPAICEAYGIRYVGADAYAKFLSNDKSLSKQFASTCGLTVARGVTIYSSIHIDLIETLPLPLVVKPAREGTSIGISNNNIIYSHQNAKEKTLELLRIFRQPVIVEEFLGGRECLVCIVGTPNELRLFGAAELLVDGSSTYFENNLFGYELKKMRNNQTLSYQSITSQIGESDKNACINLFKRLGKIDALRIDTRLCGSELKLIELSPIPYFSDTSAYACVFNENNLSIEQGISLVIENTISAYQLAETNGLER